MARARWCPRLRRKRNTWMHSNVAKLCPEKLFSADDVEPSSTINTSMLRSCALDTASRITSNLCRAVQSLKTGSKTTRGLFKATGSTASSDMAGPSYRCKTRFFYQSSDELQLGESQL